MSLRPVRLVAPAEAPVSLAEVKARCRVDHADDDDLLGGLAEVATGHLDGYAGVLGRCLVTQTWRQDFLGWGGCLRLPFPDATVTALTYRDAAGAVQTVVTSSYRLFAETGGPVLRFSPDWSAPTLDDDAALGPPVSVTFTAGYGTAAEVPWALWEAIRLHVWALYDGEPEDRWRPTYDLLVAPYRMVRL